MINAFCHTFSRKFFKMQIFPAGKVCFSRFFAKPKNSHNFLQASHKPEKIPAWWSNSSWFVNN